MKYDTLLLTAGSVFLVNRIFKGGLVNEDFELIFHMPYQNIKECAKEIFFIINRYNSEELSAIKRKFS
jgi:hypothetical protein